MKKIIIFFVFMSFSCGVLADTVILKDDQKFEADVISFDAYYLLVKLSGEKEVSIPWQEVRYIKHTTTETDWRESMYINDDDIEVKTLVVPMDKNTAFQKALFPGVVVHGAGHFYAKDKNRGMSIVSAQILSLVMMGISINGVLAPRDVSGVETDNVSNVVFYTGLAVFLGSWIYDMIFAPAAVERYNEKNTFLLEDRKAVDEEIEKQKKAREDEPGKSSEAEGESPDEE
ncbi:MAG: hypothetical protein ACLFP1_02955 [Candidatus Goldiibacteriota bacterium]